MDATLLCEGVEGDGGYGSGRFRENADLRDDILRWDREGCDNVSGIIIVRS